MQHQPIGDVWGGAVRFPHRPHLEDIPGGVGLGLGLHGEGEDSQDSWMQDWGRDIGRGGDGKKQVNSKWEDSPFTKASSS